MQEVKNQMKLLFWSCFVTTTSFGQTLTLQPDPATGMDAEVFSCVPCDYADKNFGNKKDFAAIAWTNSGNLSKVRSLIRFELSVIPANAIVSGAILSLYYNPSSSEGTHSGTNASYMQRITAPWVESTVTWNNQPPTTTLNQASLSTSSSSTQNYLSINVTTMVQDMVANPSTNFGFMLRLQNESVYKKLIFASSDNIVTTIRPMLVINYTAPLPVELISFNAHQSHDEIELTWITASEKNNSGFEVQRSLSASEYFEPLGWVAGNGTSSSIHNYCYSDQNIKPGMRYFYRLKQIDFDGKYFYSDIISAETSNHENKITIAPNPFSDRTNIMFNLENDANVRVEMYDVGGKIMSVLLDNAFTKGNHQLIITDADTKYKSGIYELVFIINDQVTRKRVIKVF